MPEKAPAEKKVFPCPWERALTLENIKKVADYWCGGKCEEARALPPSLYCEILGLVIAKDKGKAIEAEEQAREQARDAKFNGLNS